MIKCFQTLFNQYEMGTVCSEWHHIIESCYKLCGMVNKRKEMFVLIGNMYALNCSCTVSVTGFTTGYIKTVAICRTVWNQARKGDW